MHSQANAKLIKTVGGRETRFIVFVFYFTPMIFVVPLCEPKITGHCSTGISSAPVKCAVVVSPERRIGGMTTGGLGRTDVGDISAFGGMRSSFTVTLQNIIPTERTG